MENNKGGGATQCYNDTKDAFLGNIKTRLQGSPAQGHEELFAFARPPWEGEIAVQGREKTFALPQLFESSKTLRHTTRANMKH